VLTALLARLVVKDKPLRYIDTHAGAGGYDLRAAPAQKNREYHTGVGKIWTAEDTPSAVARWLALVRDYNAGPTLKRYPGSPWLAEQCLRPIDRLFLYELHPAEHRALKNLYEGARRVKVLREDGLASCIGLVPPPDKRALLLIDPSYELRDEHRQVIDTVLKVHKRFASCVIAIWYPVIDRRWAERYERALRATRIPAIATYELSVTATAERGLAGSGMFIVNPPWQLDEELQASLAWLAEHLAVDRDATYRAIP
jgi:23S rRNA (adenine2030-N6)-methyltransferase